MSSNSYVIGNYLYLLAVVLVFLFSCRSWAFIRVTFLYFIFLTFFACLALYGSGFYLESHLAQFHKEGRLATFPFTLDDGMPDANTISKSSTTYWNYLIPLTVIFVTFPQAVTRSAGLSNEKSPTEVMGKLVQAYGWLQHMFSFFKKSLPYITGTVANVYDIGEGVFVLIALSSLASPFSKQNWVLTVISCFFIVLLAGTDLANTRSKGLISIALRLFVPGIIGALQRFAVFVLRLLTYLFCILLTAVIGLNLYLQAQHIFHTQSLNIFVIIVILLLALGVLILSFMFLWKVITFPIKKLIEWMEIEIVDPSVAM